MPTSDFNPKDLMKEKKLWDIYKASRRISFSRFNFVTTLIVFLLLCLNSWVTTQPIYETIEIVRNMASSGLARVFKILCHNN